MSPAAVTGLFTFVNAFLLAFAWARVRHWKRAYLAEVATNQRILDTRTAQTMKNEAMRAMIDGIGQQPRVDRL